MNFIKSLQLAAFISAAIAMGGCASTQKLSGADKAKLTAVKVTNSAEKSTLFLLAPSGANAGLMFGAIGGLAASGTIEDSRVAFAAYLEKNSVSIEKIVREEIELALRESGKVAIAAADNTTVPTISVSIPQYGFGVPHLLSSNVVPVLQIKCDMVDVAGKLIWSENNRMLPSIGSPMPSIPWGKLRDDPKQMEEQLRHAAKFLSQKIVAEL